MTRPSLRVTSRVSAGRFTPARLSKAQVFMDLGDELRLLKLHSALVSVNRYTITSVRLGFTATSSRRDRTGGIFLLQLGHTLWSPLWQDTTLVGSACDAENLSPPAIGHMGIGFPPPIRY